MKVEQTPFVKWLFHEGYFGLLNCPLDSDLHHEWVSLSSVLIQVTVKRDDDAQKAVEAFLVSPDSFL